MPTSSRPKISRRLRGRSQIAPTGIQKMEVIMNILELIGGIVLLVVGVVIVVVILLQESKDKNSMGAITGGSSDSYYGKNKPQTREAALAKITKILAVAFFALLIFINLVPLIFK